jgi:hypothetical protein
MTVGMFGGLTAQGLGLFCTLRWDTRLLIALHDAFITTWLPAAEVQVRRRFADKGVLWLGRHN